MSLYFKLNKDTEINEFLFMNVVKLNVTYGISLLSCICECEMSKFIPRFVVWREDYEENKYYE